MTRAEQEEYRGFVERAARRGRRRGVASRPASWCLLLTLFCLVLASCCCCTVASARLLPELERTRDATENEGAVASGQQQTVLPDASQVEETQKPGGGSQVFSAAVRALGEQADRFLTSYFTADYADPKPDPNPDPSHPPMIPHPYFFRNIPFPHP